MRYGVVPKVLIFFAIPAGHVVTLGDVSPQDTQPAKAI